MKYLVDGAKSLAGSGLIAAFSVRIHGEQRPARRALREARVTETRQAGRRSLSAVRYGCAPVALRARSARAPRPSRGSRGRRRECAPAARWGGRWHVLFLERAFPRARARAAPDVPHRPFSRCIWITCGSCVTQTSLSRRPCATCACCTPGAWRRNRHRRWTWHRGCML